MLQVLEERKLPSNYSDFKQQYSKIEAISFDYEVLEKTKRVVAVPYEGDWKDLGTWNTLTEEIGTKVIGKGKISADSKDTHLINELGLPIHVLGISNAVIAASPEGILVTDKEASPRLKELMSDFKQRPMYEEKQWGWYKVIECTNDAENQVVIRRIKVFKNCCWSEHSLSNHTEIATLTVVSGEGIFITAGIEREVKLGEVISASSEYSYSFFAITDLELIAVQLAVSD